MAKKRAAASTAQTAKVNVQVKEFQSAVAQLSDAIEKLGKIQLCVECSCGPCNECSVCRVCQVCRVCKVCQVCQVCQVCKVCQVCYECSCGPCAAGG